MEKESESEQERGMVTALDCLEDLQDDSDAIDSSWSWIQTMNYVGQLAGQVFVQVKELYRGLNPATLSGCIDIIVVRQPDGSLQCSPFHVRFGKMGVLRSREKVVDIEVNGEPVDLHMKLGENGEAFFVKQTENDQEVVPSYLATSPILSDGAVMMSSLIQTLGPSVSGIENGAIKKRRKRRRKSKVDSVKREPSAEYSEDEEVFTIDISSNEGDDHTADRNRTSLRDMMNDDCSSGSHKQNAVYARSDGDWSPMHSPNVSRPCSPKSDSELVTKAGEEKQQNPAMLWAWGELPQPSFMPSKPDSPAVCPVSIPVSDNTHFKVIPDASASNQHYPADSTATLRLIMPTATTAKTTVSEHVKTEVEPMRLDSNHLAVGAENITAGTRPKRVQNGFDGQDLDPETMEPETTAVLAARLVSEVEEGAVAAIGSSQQSKTDSPSKRKDKRSRHLGSDGVYLDDLTELDPEVAALYFPKSEGSSAGRVCCENTTRSMSMSPQSVGSSGADSGVDSYSEQTTDLPSIALSLCGGLTDSREITKEYFQEKAVTYNQFAANPALIDDPNLVVKIGSKYYNWSTAAPILLAMQVFQKPLPKATIESIMKEKMPRKGGRWWFSWRGRGSSSKTDSASVNGSAGGAEHAGKMNNNNRRKDESSSSDEEHISAKQTPSSTQPENIPPQGGVSYRKTLRLTSDQLASLQLKEGPNDVVFSVTTQYQGTCRCEGTIYLWNWDDKIIISDIDGTITRSDTLGHILPTLGKDWTHQGIARLFHKVSQNGYKFMYCSARAIGMAGMTRGYLHWVNESGTMLPQGPVLLSPSSLFSALHREVIEKKPEKFKVECLTDIKNLFFPNTQPFYAAFGNRATDVYSYKEVGVPLNRIFTVNPKGELVQEHAKTNISSYARLGEVVDHVFPLLRRASSSDFPCSDTYSHFTYWREQLPLVDSQDCAGKASS
ncbi:phosphatidate phosphatase LPIN1 isoform X1 [Astyanax mexicanus]|uniref:phosphatidate phosphatase LPIN1 isoform X1 n=2 Tax=Astyanax mexicanus TaxID=7994 RepID=UPI0020CB09D3|nr:phosphatidate phosphatase LPIN1 isoform X1 [Astyanax mexicanus]